MSIKISNKARTVENNVHKAVVERATILLINKSTEGQVLLTLGQEQREKLLDVIFNRD